MNKLFVLGIALLLLLPLISAETFYHNVSLSSSGAANQGGGPIVKFNQTLTLVSVERPAASTASTAVIYRNGTAWSISTALSGNVFTFNNITVDRSSEYGIFLCNPAGAYTQVYNTGGTYPRNSWNGTLNISYIQNAEISVGNSCSASQTKLGGGTYQNIYNIVAIVPVPAATNATISATDAWTGNTLHNIYVTINGTTTYNSNISNGVITLPYLSNYTYTGNILIGANNHTYYWNITNNTNLSESRTVQLTPSISTFALLNNYTGAAIQNFSITINGTTVSTTNYTAQFWFRNTTVNYLDNGSNTFNVTYESSQFPGYTTQTYGPLNQWRNITKSLIPSLNKYVYVRDADNALVTSICTYNGIQTVGSTFFVGTYGVSNLTFYCQENGDLQSGQITLTNDSIAQTLTLQYYQLILNFDAQTNVTLTQSNGTFTNFVNQNNLTYRQSNISEGKVSVYFGKNITVSNQSSFYGQAYEYLNDEETNVNESIHIMNSATQAFWSVVRTTSAQGVSNAIIRVYEINDSSGTHVSRLVGQYLSQNINPTIFYFDENKKYHIIVDKDGYQQYVISNYDPNNNPTSSTEPFVFELISTNGNGLLTIGASTSPNVITNTSEEFTLSIAKPSVTRAYYITQYRIDHGAVNSLGLINVSGNASYFEYMYQRDNTLTWHATLEPGVDYPIGTIYPINVTVYLRVDGNYLTYSGRITPYVPTTNFTNITPPISEGDTESGRWLGVFFMIGTLFLAGIVRYKTQENTLPNYVYHGGLFMLGLMLYDLYILVSVLVLLYYVGRYFKKTGGDEA